MKCPHCGSDQIAIIKYDDSGDHITRTRGCNSCGKQFVTVETIKSGKRTFTGGRNGSRT